ncbi:alkaline phosphatase [Andreprevotia lacus DSM 23236]|jgi:alkaline phosphatase|uniref:Alkaline phosphatase n=1 Tax=Andreprevotia lacus DSM 23236 TaxID=1121001 RepID=A0A1W1XPC8_9NEIS|nr:alkaline phosphatase [Andreprevotia lacus]SMC25705.1 alkaline phosphatase [Andreprevotia lacus DSM 23236]
MNLKHTLIAALCAAALSPAYAAGEAKNVIFFLGDGMGPATVTAARIYKYGEAGTLSMEKLDRTARVKTYSNDAQTTDSAPSMAAYMTGVKMNNEVISMSADTKALDPAGKPYLSGADSTCPANNGKAVDTMLEIAKAKGKAVGSITTTRVTHATPAATYSHVCHRDAENTIAAQAVPGGAGYNSKLGTGLDVLMGGGSRFFLPTTVTGGKRTDGRNLINEMKAQGYTYASTGTELKAVDGKATNKLFALFTNDHMDYELDRVKKSLDQPSLADMTLKSIDVLGKNSNGFFLMVEGGRIDHALHATNAKRALEDAVAFDTAIQAALTEMEKRDPGLKNTLIVVTADHDHTMTINGYGKKGSNILGTVKNYKDGTEAKDADGNNYTALVFGNGPNRPATRKMLVEGSTDATQVLHDDYLQEAALKMGSESHGGGDVMLFATGAGVASKTFKGTIDNTKVFSLIKQAFGF